MEGARVRALKRWHNWFAWYPVRAPSNDKTANTRVWLETIQRKGTRKGDWGEYYWDWEYKLKDQKSKEKS